MVKNPLFTVTTYVIDVLTLTARGLSLDVRICRLQMSKVFPRTASVKYV